MDAIAFTLLTLALPLTLVITLIAPDFSVRVMDRVSDFATDCKREMVAAIIFQLAILFAIAVWG